MTQTICVWESNADQLLDAEGKWNAKKVLFGEYNPGGKLPISFPRSVGHIPAYYNHKPFDRRGYFNDEVTPLYPFGYGLSYSRFEISALQLSTIKTSKDKIFKVTVDVKNTGNVAADEVVQLYIRYMVSSVTLPIKELKGFSRVSLEAGSSKTIEFELTPDHFAFYSIDKSFVVEPGKFKIMVGNSAANLKEAVLEVE
ncbi:Glycosyl hydrolase family 3 C-terminal domain-containing protein [Saccharicrinis carchari]|uniref:Glycosyl hydrolase family 3 C-terminal domain-containing protein n=1 Tax=Saccharicrinis carchari TaxID=1168039 RepID=A0A521DS48_SACCC|nr:fibronectin type III-like domain-contianing protein [Saccharicrinis carchari]SMO74546.1 Glycosyl hydrolase family 3 C-terminal domain-containing protein [Saccharicrinis carchari]